MINISLKGILAETFGPLWKLKVESVLEIFEALEANTGKISNSFVNIQKFSTHFMVLINGKVLPAYLINAKTLKKGDTVEILPVMQGGGPVAFVVIFVIGLLLVVASYIITKMMTPKKPKDVKTNSTILGGLRNILNRNIVVPIGYGRLMLGSAVVSNSIGTQKRPRVVRANQDYYYTPYTELKDSYNSSTFGNSETVTDFTDL